MYKTLSAIGLTFVGAEAAMFILASLANNWAQSHAASNKRLLESSLLTIAGGALAYIGEARETPALLYLGAGFFVGSAQAFLGNGPLCPTQ